MAKYNRIVASLREASPTNSITKLKEVLAFLEVLYQNRTTRELNILSVDELNVFADRLIGLVRCILATEEHTKKAAQVVEKASSIILPYFYDCRREKALWARKSETHRNPMLIGAYTTQLILKTIAYAEGSVMWYIGHQENIKPSDRSNWNLCSIHIKHPIEVNRDRTADSIAAPSITWHRKSPTESYQTLNNYTIREAPFYIGKHRTMKGKEKIRCKGLSKKL